MDIDQARALLKEKGHKFTEDQMDHGMQFRLQSGPIVNVFHTGKCVVQGKRQDLIKGLFEDADGYVTPANQSKNKPAEARQVFIVYGHDTPARTELEAMLRRWGLEPLILDQLTSGGQTIIEKLESVRESANFAVVLATPDDEGHRKEHPEEKAFRARQNVVLELGMMLAILGRPKVAILLKSDVAMERPSDIHGLIYISFKDSVAEAALTLSKEINAQGIKIDLSKV